MNKLFVSFLTLLVGTLPFTPVCIAQTIYTPTQKINIKTFIQNDKNQPVVVKETGLTSEFSTKVLILNQDEKPHIHKDHDLLVVLLEGKTRINFDDKSYSMVPGDTVIIPKDTPHWAENLSSKSAKLLLVSAPIKWNNDYVEVD